MSQPLSTLHSTLSPHLNHLLTRIKAQPLLATVLAGLTTATLLAAINDYRAFLALGPGGLPYNPIGWLVNLLVLRPLSLSKRDRLFIADYLPASAATEYIRSLPSRSGERAHTGGIVPHRQLSQLAPESMAAPLQQMLRDFLDAQDGPLKGKLVMRKSHYERHNDALYVSDALLAEPATQTKVPRTARVAKGEAAHVHGDRSLHLYLHPADAAAVVEKGWGERHRLSRTWPWWLGGGTDKLGLGHTWIMLYGPRDGGELEVVKGVVGEGLRWMVGERV
ncbi:uncharacterized protein HMPREF1541_09545 [Cyphellophora europaea CBS 101466]|uniref:Luciferase domain-containing protein n=1 Tax=Cyphellophora europaea (strain CBS 101466) TaxID=1220924 RepID=W2SAI5_CYPE1|nr:uncharacterized protein HMPREF1541_09545 [Cyphellophora europaea CBS 101466]ETN45712.1 hypothetical protein HMPREF1541_09545 [Cyphellophora europaea CBS 101466]